MHLRQTKEGSELEICTNTVIPAPVVFTLIFASSGPFVDSCTLLPCFSLCL